VGPQLSLGRGVRVYLLPGGQLELGARVRLQERVLIVVHPGATLHIGEGTYVGPGCELHAMEAVEVGADCLLAGEVILIDHDHVFDLASPVREKEHTTGAVSVGDGCWLGTRAVLTRGSQVGRHCVVGAGAVVTGPIPDGSIATGIPAREKGTR
jgi:acetyltransferase-like isoleucine patch superfamily enzyme